MGEAVLQVRIDFTVFFFFFLIIIIIIFYSFNSFGMEGLNLRCFR